MTPSSPQIYAQEKLIFAQNSPPVFLRLRHAAKSAKSLRPTLLFWVIRDKDFDPSLILHFAYLIFMHFCVEK